jgi:hypothetical protein
LNVIKRLISDNTLCNNTNVKIVRDKETQYVLR